MRIHRNMAEIAEDQRGSVAAIGNFDGVHLGHRAVIERTQHIASGLAAPTAVVTFEPHPRVLFQPDARPFRLSSSDSRAEALAGLGVDALFEVPFDADFAQITAEDFVSDILISRLGLRHVVVGHDFHFGHRRRGNAEMLVEFSENLGFGVTRVEAVAEEDGAVYSSSRVRQCLREGDPAGAAELLGRPWEIRALVETGDQRGRTIGFPTANLRLGPLLAPTKGVYAVRVRVDAEADWLSGVANFGRRPTVNDLGELLEVHLFGVDRDLYGRVLHVQFIDFIRPERKFSGLDELKAQIAEDAARAVDILKR